MNREARMPSPTIGILAGMGPRSTAPFIDLIVNECQAQYGARHDIDFPKMLICSQPTPFYDDRPVDHTALEAAICDGLQYLEKAGVDFLAIACNTAHISYPRLAESVAVRLLNMVDLTLEAIPLSTQKLALIAARPTAESRIFQKAIHRSGYKLIDLEWQNEVDRLLAATRMSTDPQVFAHHWSKLTTRAGDAGVDTLIVACLDLSSVVRHANTGLHIVDGAQCLAQGIVAEWLARRVED